MKALAWVVIGLAVLVLLATITLGALSIWFSDGRFGGLSGLGFFVTVAFSIGAALLGMVALK